MTEANLPTVVYDRMRRGGRYGTALDGGVFTEVWE
jgi:hypothetical protein